MNKFFRIFLIATVAITFLACDDDNGSEPARQLGLKLSSTEVGPNDVSQFVAVTCSGQWTITFDYVAGDAGWCSVDPQSGSGSKNNVRLTYSLNTQEEARSVKLIIESNGAFSYATLTQKGLSGNGGTDPGVDPTPQSWIELPEIVENDAYRYTTHYTTINGKRVRNFTLCFDTDERIAYWVAYPHHSMYVGSSGRTDAWAFDPNIEQSLQTNLARSYKGSYDRGHQIPSMDRTCNVATNEQTFYFTNMTPQLGGLNQYFWATLETKVKNVYMPRADTLYVVTGAILQTQGNNESVSYVGTNLNDGSQTAIPNYYFKVLLSYKNNNYDKAIGFWVEHKAADSDTPIRPYARSVREIEELTGFNFFSNLPQEIQDRVKRSYDPQDWDL